MYFKKACSRKCTQTGLYNFLRRKLLFLSCTWRLAEVKQTKSLVYFCEYRGMLSLRWTICLICFQNIRYPQHLPQFPGRLVYYCWDNERFRRGFFCRHRRIRWKIGLYISFYQIMQILIGVFTSCGEPQLGNLCKNITRLQTNHRLTWG